jgi:hypothetical protein
MNMRAFETLPLKTCIANLTFIIQAYSREGYFGIFILPHPTRPMAVTTK